MNFELFENIEFENLKTLYQILEKDFKHLDSAKLQYSKQSTYLQETLNFLVNTNLIKINGNNVKIHIKSDMSVENKIFNQISKNLEYGLAVKEYLDNFINVNGKYKFRPDAIYNSLTSDLRNFLISSNKIIYENEEYIIVDNKLLDLFKNKEFSPEQLQKILEKQNLLGLEAEKLVVKYETEKIKSFNQNLNIDHVALRDVSAGYDIRSYELDSESIKEIYIEVKAVSISNYKFHLSMQENQTANKFLDRYYLYLLPVDLSNKEKFDYKKLLKIQNINKTIFQNKKEWIIEEDGYVVSRKI